MIVEVERKNDIISEKEIDVIVSLINSDLTIPDKLSRYRGLFLITAKGTDFDFRSKSIFLTQEDIEKINHFIKHKESYFYSDNFYRIDLKDYIMIFKVYTYKNHKTLIGHFLENNYVAKWELANTKSKIEFSILKKQIRELQSEC
jgi:hypothetical protein